MINTGFQGAFAERAAPELGAHAIRAAVGHAGVAANAIDEVLMGCVLSAGASGRDRPARSAVSSPNRFAIQA